MSAATPQEIEIFARLARLYAQREKVVQEIEELKKQLPLDYWMDQEVDITVPEHLWRS